jgi:hypothetical protein
MERFTKFFTSIGGVLASLAAVIGGAAALYVAFGGGTNQTNNPDPPPPVVDTTSDAAIEDWRTQAEDVCKDLKRRVARLGPPPTDAAGQVSYMQQSLQISSSMASEMRALEEPDAIADDVGRLLDALDEQVQISVAFLDAFQVGDVVTLETLRQENQAAARDTNRFAADLGLKECVEFT